MKICVAMAQVNPTVGDLDGNADLVRGWVRRAQSEGADLVAFPEMVITGYPTLDLLPPREVTAPAGNRRPEREEFLRLNKEHIQKLATEIHGITAVVGFVDYNTNNLFNAAAIIQDGRVEAVVHKTLLPTYDVFDELRYFATGKEIAPVPVTLRGQRVELGVSVCEDIWDEEIGYGTKVVDTLCAKGAQLIVNVNASPFHDKIRQVRLKILTTKARRLRVPIFYVNMVGGQDELVFDGQSLAVDAEGRLIGIGKQFQEDLVLVGLDMSSWTGFANQAMEPSYNREEEMFNALVLGVRDYFRKTGFERALIGLSGGIDSSLVAVIAAEALGRDNIMGISMPSRYSSEHSKTDAKKLAENLGIGFLSIPIEPIFSAYEVQLRTLLDRQPPNVTEENIQSRIRGNILMALSNKLGHLVLATGNKTELALGYATLYGDMSGGLEVIGDVSKSEVYALARYYNKRARNEVIPESCLSKIPSAELRPDQYDPFDYAVVSPLVDDIIENRLSRSELIAKGYNKTIVDDAFRRIRNAEYKRRQAPPAIKITKKAFGLGWKMPIVNKFSGTD